MGVSAADVDRALTEDRSLLITWLNRGTLHLVRTDDYPWLHALTGPRLATAVSRRLSQEGVSPAATERGLRAIESSLAGEGPLTRVRLRERVASADVPVEGQALIHLLAEASLRGLIVRGPVIGKQHAYVLVRDWLGEAAPVERDKALAELARRYLAGHGPADDRDLAKWAGLPLRDVRVGLSAVAPELEQRPDGLVALAGRPPPAELPPPRLLGAFDPVLLGWTSRQPIVGANEAAIVLGGLFLPFALVRGQAAAGWRLEGGGVQLEPFIRLSRAETAALMEDGLDVVRFLEGVEAGE
jgi:hypothetical protein